MIQSKPKLKLQQISAVSWSTDGGVRVKATENRNPAFEDKVAKQ